MIYLSTINTMADDDLAMQGARASVVKVLTKFSRDIPATVPEGMYAFSYFVLVPCIQNLHECCKFLL